MKTSNKKPGNGLGHQTEKMQLVKPQTAPTPAPAQLVVAGPKAHEILDQYKGEILSLKIELDTAKMAVADIALQIAEIEGRKMQALKKMVELNTAFFEKVKEAGKGSGLEIEKDSWSFDYAAMTFTKVDRPPQ